MGGEYVGNGDKLNVKSPQFLGWVRGVCTLRLVVSSQKGPRLMKMGDDGHIVGSGSIWVLSRNCDDLV